jgi:hypothetical protein
VRKLYVSNSLTQHVMMQIRCSFTLPHGEMSGGPRLCNAVCRLVDRLWNGEPELRALTETVEQTHQVFEEFCDEICAEARRAA